MFYCEELIDNTCSSWVEVTTLSQPLSLSDASSWLGAAVLVLTVAFGVRLILRVMR